MSESKNTDTDVPDIEIDENKPVQRLFGKHTISVDPGTRNCGVCVFDHKTTKLVSALVLDFIGDTDGRTEIILGCCVKAFGMLFKRYDVVDIIIERQKNKGKILNQKVHTVTSAIATVATIHGKNVFFRSSNYKLKKGLSYAKRKLATVKLMHDMLKEDEKKCIRQIPTKMVHHIADAFLLARCPDRGGVTKIDMNVGELAKQAKTVKLNC